MPQRSVIGLLTIALVLSFTVVLSGLNSDRSNITGKMSSNLYKSNPNIIDSGGGTIASSNHTTAASIGQPMIGEVSSSMYTNEGRGVRLRGQGAVS